MGTANERKGKYYLRRAENGNPGDLWLLSHIPTAAGDAGVLLTISKLVDVRGSMCSICKYVINVPHQRVSANRTDLEQLRVKLQSILSIISSYRDNGGLRALDYRVEKFCVYVFVLSMPVWLSWIILRAINLQIDAVEKLLGNSLWTRTLEDTKDADAVLKVFRNISRLCDVFQVSFSHHGQRYPCIWPHRKDRYPTPPKPDIRRFPSACFHNVRSPIDTPSFNSCWENTSRQKTTHSHQENFAI